MHIWMLIKSQSEVRLHTGCSAHFHPTQSTRPSFWVLYEGLVLRVPPIHACMWEVCPEPDTRLGMQLMLWWMRERLWVWGGLIRDLMYIHGLLCDIIIRSFWACALHLCLPHPPNRTCQLGIHSSWIPGSSALSTHNENAELLSD